MKKFLIFLLGALIVTFAVEDAARAIVYIGCAFISWAYYRMGKSDGVKEGRREVLVGKRK